MKVTVKIETDNDAFSYSKMWEVARIIRNVTTKIEVGVESGFCTDFNGNTVGTWGVEND